MQNTKCKKSLQQHIEKKNWKLHTQNTWILIARIEKYLKNSFASVGLMEYLLSPGVLVCFAHTKPNFRLCVASKNLKLLIASPLVVAKTFERCKPSIKCQNIGFNVKYNSASPVALVSGVQKLCGFVSSSIFLKTHRTVGSSSPFIKSEGKRRETLVLVLAGQYLKQV